MNASFWNGFLEFVAKSEPGNSIFFSILRQTEPAEVTESLIVLRCDNSGIKMYLDKKISVLEKYLSTHLKKNLKVALVISPPKKKKEDAPLLRFQPAKEDLFVRAGLRAKHTFENFAVSGSNQVAFAAASAVSKSPGSAYNPLFLYGGVGVGKTHLAQAIAHTIIEADQEKRVFFCPGDQFTNELIEAIREKSTPKFRRKYRHLNLLLIDDIQFIAGKNTVQEEFFHTFNAVVSAGGQIVLTSDRPPLEIKNLEDRLRSRFSGGLIVDIQSPDFELRSAILLIKANEKNIAIDIEAAKIIAEQVADTRALEGALLSIYAKILGKKDRIDIEAVENYFQEKTAAPKKISPSDVVKTICSFYNIKQSHLKSADRTEDLARARHITMYILRKELRLNLTDVADILKRKDHTTIMHGVDKISRLLIKDTNFKQEVDRIINSLYVST